MPDQPAKQKSELRWYQFTLKRLLISVSIFALFCSWLAVKMNQAEKQKKAICDIKLSGGSVWYDHNIGIYGEHKKSSIDPPIFPPKWLHDCLGEDFFSNVDYVEIQDDAASEYLKSLPNLRRLKLQGNAITDKSLEQIKDIVTIRELYIIRTKITDTGVVHLSGLTNLSSLVLCSHITPSCLKHLEGLRNLRCLYLPFDNGIEVQNLQKTLPNLELTKSPRIPFYDVFYPLDLD
jgi:hypothetical protein